MAKNLTLGVAEYVLLLKDEMSNVASSAMDNLDQRVEMSGQKMTAIGTGMQVAGAAIVAGFAGATNAAIDFESGISRIATLGVDNLDVMRDTILEVSTSYGVDLVDAANAAYDAISAGVPAAEIPEFLAVSAKAAAAGMTDLSVAVDLGTSVASAFGMEFSNVGEIFDQAFLAAKWGKTTIDELSASIGDVAPVAKATGVTTEELFSSIAAGTLAGIETSKSVTGLKAALSNIIKPTKDASEMAEQLGVSFDVGTLKSMGLAKFLEMLKEATNGNIEVMGKLFGSVEALNLMMALTGEQSDDLTKILADMEKGTFGVNEAFDAFAKNNAGFAIEQFNSQIDAASVMLGEIFIPSLTRILENLNPILEWMRDFAKEHPNITFGLVSIATAMSVIAFTAGTALQVMGLYKIALYGIGAAASAAAGGTVAGGAAAGVGGAVAGAAGAVGGGGGLAAFGSALMTATALTATAVIGIGAVSVALAAVGIAAYDYYQANQELEESQKSLDDTERQYIETLKAKGVVIDETRLKGMDEAQQRAYLAAQETAERETLARAWFTYFAERTESETDFARMKNLMLNEAIDAEEAAFLVSKGISADKVQMIMKASQEETDTILRELGYQKNESEATHQAIASSAAGAARDRQEAFINTSIEIAKNEQQLAEVTVSVWDRVIETIKSYTAWIWPQLQEISRFMADMLLPNYVSDYFMPSTPVPGLATGGIVRTGGIVDVHKNERIILPAGSDVVPARHSKQVDAMMNGGGGEININIGTVQMASDMDVREVGRQLGREVKKQLRMRGVTTAFGSA
jgi:TP901 family phage tail tape measure protein